VIARQRVWKVFLMASVIAGLKSVDFYRKLKKDLQQELTEASFAGKKVENCE
jgi:hypothetical protein